MRGPRKDRSTVVASSVLGTYTASSPSWHSKYPGLQPHGAADSARYVYASGPVQTADGQSPRGAVGCLSIADFRSIWPDIVPDPSDCLMHINAGDALPTRIH